MSKFRDLKKNAQNGEDKALVDNFRLIQSLNERTVYINYKAAAETINSGHLLRMAVASCVAVIVSAMLAHY